MRALIRIEREASPRPWHTANFINGIEDAHNGKVAANIRDADAALIVDAVNERDRLRDLVWRLTEYAAAVTGYRPLILEVVSSEHPAWTFDGAALLREARAALGEGETPTGKGAGA
jgi:hypothetical protein